MKSTKTVLAVAIVIAGFAYAVSAGHPQIDSLKHSHRCCGPQPEDARVYHMFLPQNETTIIIPIVEGTNGFVVTDIISPTQCSIYQDTGKGPVILFKTFKRNSTFHFETGIPLVAGSAITVLNEAASDFEITIMGYVY